MATPIRIKRSAVPGKRPTVDQLLSAELAYNTYDGELTAKRERPGIGTDIIRIGAGATVTNILYVTRDGNDSNTGRKLGDAKATIGAALTEATTGTVIRVSAGSYLENNPLIIPEQVSIVGDSLREVSVSPLNPNQDLFYVSNGNYIAEMSYTGTLNTGKAIFSFNPEEIGYFDQSPYVQNCTNFIPNSIGMKIDGSKAIGPIKSMVVDSYTQYNQGGIGVSITNEGYAQLVSIFTICDDVAIFCGSGAACDLTNSNSSFGNYGLVADGIGPLKYTGIVTQSTEANSDTFVLDLNVPTIGVQTATYDNVTGIVTITTQTPHKFSVGMGISITGLEFTCPSGPGIVTYPSGNKGYIFEAVTVAPGRYVDAYNSIQANRREIQDKSLAAIAVEYTGYANTNFYFPGENETNSRSRYYDATRLIQKNKQEIVDKSLAAVAIAHSDFYFPGDNTVGLGSTTPRSRYYDSYRLIQRNRDVIVDAAWTSTSNAYPDFNYTETKCKRDIGFFVDAISTDVFTGGNSYARDFVLQYFNGTTPIGIATTERAPSVFAFEQARDLMRQAITNTLVGAAYSDLTITPDPLTLSNTDPLSCADVQSNIINLVGIVTVSIGAGNTDAPFPATPNRGYFDLSVGIGTTVSPGGVKCARDLGYLVDAVSTDVFTGGNKYSRDFTRQYFDNAGNPISNGLVGETAESVTAFNALRDYSKKAITNQLNYKETNLTVGYSTYPNIGSIQPNLPSGNPNACADVQSNIDTLVEIVTNIIGIGSIGILNNTPENLGTFTDGASKCARDIGYIIDAVSTDVRDFTSKNSIEATKAYFKLDGTLLSNGLAGETEQTVVAFNKSRDLMKLAITNNLNNKNLSLAPDLLTNSNTDPASCANVQSFINNLVGIITTRIGVGNLNTLPLPSVSMDSTQFSAYVGTSTLPHTYNSGGTVKINVSRPFDGQIVYFDRLYYSINGINITSGGSGYTGTVEVIIEPPEPEWGIPATAVAQVVGGTVTSVEMVSNGRGYTTTPKVTFGSPGVGINTATGSAILLPTYYPILRSTPVSAGICTITLTDNVPYAVGVGTEALFFKQSRVLASGHSLEYIGSGTDINRALPARGGVPIQENETVALNGGLVVYTSTDQSGNFRIGDGVQINQLTGTISGRDYSKSLFSSITPFILALSS